jgi:hypothetical protein
MNNETHCLHYGHLAVVQSRLFKSLLRGTQLVAVSIISSNIRWRYIGMSRPNPITY